MRLFIVIPILLAAAPGCRSVAFDETPYSSPWEAALDHDRSVPQSRSPYVVRHQSKPTFAATDVYEWFEMHPVLGYTLITASIVLPIVLINEGKN